MYISTALLMTQSKYRLNVTLSAKFLYLHVHRFCIDCNNKRIVTFQNIVENLGSGCTSIELQTSNRGYLSSFHVHGFCIAAQEISVQFGKSYKNISKTLRRLPGNPPIDVNQIIFSKLRFIMRALKSLTMQ